MLDHRERTLAGCQAWQRESRFMVDAREENYHSLLLVELL